MPQSGESAAVVLQAAVRRLLVTSNLRSARYTAAATPFALASSGDVRLLSLNWLVKHAATGKPLPRRQELPEAAFADVAALRRAHGALPKEVAAVVLPILSISYTWLSADHPDATGEQLRHIVDTLRPHAAEWREFFVDVGVFLE